MDIFGASNKNGIKKTKKTFIKKGREGEGRKAETLHLFFCISLFLRFYCLYEVCIRL